MTEAVVEVRDSEGLITRSERIVVNGPQATFEVKTEQIEVRLARTLDAPMRDLIDIAAVVFAADSSFPRGGPTRPGFGAGWRRSFHVRIALRRPDVWNRPELKAALIAAVTFLTDDNFDFTFTTGSTFDSGQQFLDLHPEAPAGFAADEIILFSGGLDSLAGAIEALATTDRRVVLVTHRSAQKLIAHQDRLAQALRERFPGRVLHIPIQARRRGSEARETTQRSRSLLFAVFGHVLAQLFGAGTISFYENGIVSHNLPISPQVIGSMATRTTHPLSLRLLEGFLSQVDPAHGFRIENHFAWLTKTEIVRKINEHGCADLIADAVSCTHVREQTIRQTHCGACSQCLDRRFAMLAAGLSAHDPTEFYRSDVLLGERDNDRSRILALDWTRHMLRLATITPQDFLDGYAGELARIVDGADRLAPRAAMQLTLMMHQRQGQTVRQVLEAALRAHGEALIDQTLHATSLLRMILAELAGTATLPAALYAPDDAPDMATDAAPSTGLPPTMPDDMIAGALPLRVSIGMDGRRHWVEVSGLGVVTGNGARVVHVLQPQHAADTANGLVPDRFRFTPAGRLGTSMEVSKSTLVRAVYLCRKSLAEAWEAIEGAPPPEPLLIENRRQHGYRIDPTARVSLGAPPQADPSARP